MDEVRTWFFEVWNEPNLKAFWTGSQEDYFKLYRYTVQALKASTPGCKSVDRRQRRMNGSRNSSISVRRTSCRRISSARISIRMTPFGRPSKIRKRSLANGRRGILREWAQETHRRARGVPVYYTEWNASSNPRDPLHDEPYAAAFATKTILEMNGLMECYSFWTFSDIFEENYFLRCRFTADSAC